MDTDCCIGSPHLPLIAQRKLAVLLGDYILDHEIDVDESKETQQCILWGRRSLFFKPRMATDFDKASYITKTAVISFPHEDTPPGHGLRQPVFHHQRNRGTQSSKGKVYH